MSRTIDYDRNKKYFETPSPKTGIGLIAIGLLFMIALPDAAKLLGAVMMVGGGALLYIQFSNRPTDEEIDADALRAIADVKQRALNKLGLDEDEVNLIEPLVVHGYYFKRIASGLQVKQGKDGVFRSSNYEGIVMFFSEHQLHAFSFQFSLTNEQESREQTDEYFYRDVVSVATQAETFEINDIKGERQQVNFEEFKLTTTGGTSIRSSIRDDGSVARVIAGARNLIREKKIAS